MIVALSGKPQAQPARRKTAREKQMEKLKLKEERKRARRLAAGQPADPPATTTAAAPAAAAPSSSSSRAPDATAEQVALEFRALAI